MANRDAVLLADSLHLLDESHDGVELLVRFADRHLELLVGIDQTLYTTHTNHTHHRSVDIQMIQAQNTVSIIDKRLAERKPLKS